MKKKQLRKLNENTRLGVFLYNRDMLNDYKSFYTNIRNKFEGKETWIIAANNVLTYFFYIAYPCLLLFIFLKHRELLLRFVLIPAISFIFLSVIRDKINEQRPYEAYDIVPIIHKDTKGNSMPSRHIFSSVIISMCFLYFHIPTGITMLLISILACCIRVIGGVHFPLDVAVGYICGFVSGLLLFL